MEIYVCQQTAARIGAPYYTGSDFDALDNVEEHMIAVNPGKLFAARLEWDGDHREAIATFVLQDENMRLVPLRAHGWWTLLDYSKTESTPESTPVEDVASFKEIKDGRWVLASKLPDDASTRSYIERDGSAHDYKLTVPMHDRIWLSLGPADIGVLFNAEGVSIDVYKKGADDDGPRDSMFCHWETYEDSEDKEDEDAGDE